jgi:hypothetical protein
MPILFRTNSTGNWQPAEEVPFSLEDELKMLLYDSPELIPVQGGEVVARAFIHEAGLPGSGRTDLVGVDENGNVYVVECKLARNDEIRRKVIGQVLEYAAYLWEWPFDRFNGLFLNRAKKSLEQLFSEKKVSEGWTYEGFRQATERSLKSGSFRLLIAVDHMNPELERTIGYSNRQGANLRLQAIEMSLYGKEGLQILVPELHGQAPTPAASENELEPTLAELEQVAESRHSKDLLTAFCDEVGKAWQDPRPSRKFGGSLRYFYNDKLIFGVSVAGKFVTPATPDGQLDIWIRTGNLSEATGMSEPELQNALKNCPHFLEQREHGTEIVYVIRLTLPNDAKRFAEQLVGWATHRNTPSDG